MKLDLSKDFDRKKYLARSDKLLEKQAKVELKECLPARSPNQNSYFHVCAGYVAQLTGYRIAEVKIKLKRLFGSFMVYEVNGEEYYTSTADLDTAQFYEFTDWLRQWAMDTLDLYIMTPEEWVKYRFEIEKELEYVK